MLIRELLGDRSAEIATIGPESPLGQAVSLMVARRIGAIAVVGPKGQVVGILSERDVLRGLDASGPALLEQAVSSLMAGEVIATSPGARVADAVTMMNFHGVRHLPVLDEGDLVDVISLRDVVERQLEDLEEENDELRSRLAAAGVPEPE
jgi:CBS domain-containing protein